MNAGRCSPRTKPSDLSSGASPSVGRPSRQAVGAAAQAPQDRRQDAAAVVVDLDRAVEPGDRLEPVARAVRPASSARHDRDASAGRGPSASPRIENVSRPVSPSDAALLARQELERQDAHPDEVGAVDPLEALGDARPGRRAAAAPWRPSRATSRSRTRARR